MKLAEILEKANAGDHDCMLLASRRYHEVGESNDESLSRYWLERAADSANPEWLSYVGEVAEYGAGVKRDPVLAERLYTKAMAIEEFIGAYMFGKMYEHSNPALAIQHLRKAAAVGHVPSQLLRLRILRSTNEITGISFWARVGALVVSALVAMHRDDVRARYWRYRDVMRPVRILERQLAGSDRSWGAEILKVRDELTERKRLAASVRPS